MFDAATYIQRRNRLKQQPGSGVLLFLGNNESPMNYADNVFPFFQDSTFLYFWGLDAPGLAAVFDVDEDRAVLYGDDPTLDDIVWTGPQPLLHEKSAAVGVETVRPAAALYDDLQQALGQGRTVHFLPQYRADNLIRLEALLGVSAAGVNEQVSTAFIKAVIAQREIKSAEEIEQIEAAIGLSYGMHTLAMRITKPGRYEREIVGALEGQMLAAGGRISFPIIFSKRGEVLHNHSHDNLLEDGDLVVHDSGAMTASYYASDITRTIPVSGRFTERQKEIYSIVLDAQQRAIEAVRPGVPFRDVHLLAAKTMTEGLKALGLMKGDVDEAVAAGAHAIFFQCGLGHMMGLDIHDMEGLGEDLVGYDARVQRSPQFGLCYLRLAKALRPGHVVTIEPGIYFIPTLMDRWRAEGKFTAFIDYDAFDAYRGFGGVRIEDDVLVLGDGYRVLGRPIPRTIDEVEMEAAR